MPKKITLTLLSATLLLAGCGTLSTPDTTPSVSGTTETADSTTETDLKGVTSTGTPDGQITAQATSNCVTFASYPSFGAGRLRASGWIRCAGDMRQLTADGIIRLYKSDRYGNPASVAPVASKVVRFTVNLTGGVEPSTLRTDASCADGLYLNKVEIYFTNTSGVTFNPAQTKAIHVACAAVNQIEAPINDVTTGIADHSWNGTYGGTGHANDFLYPRTGVPTGISSQAQLNDYLFNILTGRYTTHSGRVRVLGNCPNGRIALFDTSKSIFIIYNPLVPYYGTAYPAPASTLQC